MSLGKKALAEALGTFWLVFGGCGAAVLAGGNIGFLGVSFAFGLTVVSMAYAIGHISGCHLNPAVSVGLVVSGREKPGILPAYIGAQVAGATLAAVVLQQILSVAGTWDTISTGQGGFATNYFATTLTQGHRLGAAILVEAVLTFFFLFVIHGATDERAPKGFAGLIIGLTLTLIHLIGIPVTNLSVNPARSTGPALMVGGTALAQLWVFWLAPLAGAAAAGLTYKFLACSDHAAAAPAASAPPAGQALDRAA